MQQKHFCSVTERPDQSTIAASKAAEHHYKSKVFTDETF